MSRILVDNYGTVIVKDATRDVKLLRLPSHAQNGKRGCVIGCMDAMCASENLRAFPKGTLHVVVLRSRAYAITKLAHGDQHAEGIRYTRPYLESQQIDGWDRRRSVPARQFIHFQAPKKTDKLGFYNKNSHRKLTTRSHPHVGVKAISRAFVAASS